MMASSQLRSGQHNCRGGGAPRHGSCLWTRPHDRADPDRRFHNGRIGPGCLRLRLCQICAPCPPPRPCFCPAACVCHTPLHACGTRAGEGVVPVSARRSSASRRPKLSARRPSRALLLCSRCTCGRHSPDRIDEVAVTPLQLWVLRPLTQPNPHSILSPRTVRCSAGCAASVSS
jgi:hypothetical protein